MLVRLHPMFLCLWMTFSVVTPRCTIGWSEGIYRVDSATGGFHCTVLSELAIPLDRFVLVLAKKNFIKFSF